MHQHLRDVGSMGLVLGLIEDDLDGSLHLVGGTVLGDQQRALVGDDAVGNAAPEGLGVLRRERSHEADGGAACDAVQQDVGQGGDVPMSLLGREGSG